MDNLVEKKPEQIVKKVNAKVDDHAHKLTIHNESAHHLHKHHNTSHSIKSSDKISLHKEHPHHLHDKIAESHNESNKSN